MSSGEAELRDQLRSAFFRQIEPDVQLAQLLGRYFGGGAHHQVLGALIHWEQHHLTQVLLAGEQHHDAIDTGSNATMRWSPERERPQHAAEFLLEQAFVIAGDGEGLAHYVRAM